MLGQKPGSATAHLHAHVGTHKHLPDCGDTLSAKKRCLLAALVLHVVAFNSDQEVQSVWLVWSPCKQVWEVFDSKTSISLLRTFAVASSLWLAELGALGLNDKQMWFSCIKTWITQKTFLTVPNQVCRRSKETVVAP